jgi:hypothetical protein
MYESYLMPAQILYVAKIHASTTYLLEKQM